MNTIRKRNCRAFTPGQIFNILSYLPCVVVITQRTSQISEISYSHGWTGTSVKWRLMRGNLSRCKLFYPHKPPLHARSSPTVRKAVELRIYNSHFPQLLFCCMVCFLPNAMFFPSFQLHYLNILINVIIMIIIIII